MNTNERPQNDELTVKSKNRKEEICLWLVRPSSGKVRKLRIKLWTILVLLFIGAVFFSGLGVLVSDYARLQFLKAKNYLLLKTVANERDHFRSKTQKLEDELAKLKSEAGRSANYQNNLKQRLDELASVMGTLKSMGALKNNDQDKVIVEAPGARASFTEEGVGGSEVECENGDLKCSSLILEGDSGVGQALKQAVYNPLGQVSTMSKKLLNSPDKNNSKAIIGDHLVSTLDEYISIIKTMPLGTPGLGHISSEFGYRRSPFNRKRMLHEGMDFSLPVGSEVVSTGEGLVKDVRWNPTYGLVIDIEHTPTLVTRFAHLKRAFVKEGEKVCRGDILGLVGSTGRSTGPHLHYEVRIDGEPTNPERFIEIGDRISEM